jgi:hypothetical protein
MRRKRVWLVGLLLLALLLSLPFLLNLDAFHAQVHQALQRQLGRRVEFGTLTGQLLPRPGVLGRRVVVYEKEEFGAEPFLYADEVRCNLSLAALLRFRLAFSEVHFQHPSINLTRNAEGAWNVVTFLLPGAEGSQQAVPPTVTATQGRINFKFGVDKQVYALTGVRLRLEPRASAGWRLSLEATPVRTDRRLTEMGQLQLTGEVGRGPDLSALPIQLQVSLRDGSVSQLWALAAGAEPAFRATASFDASLQGTPSLWNASGSLRVSDVRRWDLVALPGTPIWTSTFAVKYLGAEKTLQVEKLVVRADKSQALVGGRVTDPLGSRRWDLSVNADLALDELKAQLATLKADVSDRLQVDGVGQLQLALKGPREEWEGDLSVPDGFTLKIPGLPDALKVADAEVRLSRGRVELLPMTLLFSLGSTLTVQGQVQLFSAGLPFQLHWSSPGVELAPLRRATEAFGWDTFGPDHWEGPATVDLDWAGQLLGEEEARWQGNVQLKGAKFYPPELNDPLELAEAKITWDRSRVKVAPAVVRLGGNVLQATLERQGRVARWEIAAEAERLNLGDIDQLTDPGRQGLLARLVGLRSRQASRWQQLAAGGTLKIGELVAGPFHLQRLEVRGEWQEGFLELTSLRFRAYDGRFDGRLQSDFRASPPRYRLAGNLKQANLQQLLGETTGLGALYAGAVGADLALETEGTNPRELQRNLQGRIVGVLHDGTINHINLVSAMEVTSSGGDAADEGEKPQPTPLQSLAGEFRITDRQVQFDGARIITSRAALELSGSVGFDGTLNVRVSGEPLRVAGRRPTPVANRALSFSYQLTGTLEQPRLTLREPAPSSPSDTP